MRTVREALPPDEAERLSAFRRSVEAVLPRSVREVLLFGSRARGEAEPDSDYDLAALLLRDGERAPTKHNAVINRFGYIATAEANTDPRLPQVGHDLNIAYDQRIDTDYNPRVQPTTAQAERCLDSARSFLVVCTEHFGFRR